MEIWDYISSTADSVRQRSPDLLSVKGFARSSYDYGWAAAVRADKAIRVDAVGQLNREFLSSLLKNATVEGVKTIPGAWPFVKVILKSVNDSKKSCKGVDLLEIKIKEREELELLKASVSRMEKQLHDLQCKAEFKRMDVEMKSQKDAVKVYQNPEDVIRVFMMKEFAGTHMLDDLVVPNIKSRKNSR